LKINSLSQSMGVAFYTDQDQYWTPGCEVEEAQEAKAEDKGLLKQQ